MARRRPGLADDQPVRPQRRAGVAPHAGQAELRGDGPAPQGDWATVSFNRFLLKFDAEEHEFTVFPDGRAIIKGTSDVDRARTLYARYIGH